MRVHVYDSYIKDVDKLIHNESVTLEHYKELLSNKSLDKSTRSIVETMKTNTEDHIALLNTIKDDEISEMDMDGDEIDD